MKIVVKRATIDEKGAALLLAIILLAVGGLVAAALLGHMGTGILAGEVYETRTAELYAADAGVEDAVWKIQNNDGYLPCTLSSPPRAYNITDVNGKSVEVVIEYVGGGTSEGNFRVTAVATTDDGGNTAAIGSNTAIEAYVGALFMDFSSLLDYAIVSNETVDIQSNNYVNGDVWLPDSDDIDGEEAVNGTVYDSGSFDLSWPDADELSNYYLEDVEGLPDEHMYPDGYVMNIPDSTSEAYPYPMGSLLGMGDLTIKGTGWIELGGTIYVKGDLALGATPSIHLDLNGQTIFAEGWIDIPPGVTLSGSGCIIAIGDVTFKPDMSTEPDEFVLVLSILGTATLLPNGSFTGCVAGAEVVQLQPGDPNDVFTVQWIDPTTTGTDLNFPGMSYDPNELPPVTEASIISWQIEQQ